jgi:hypothetical protein
MIKLLARRSLRAFSARYQYSTGYLENLLEQNPTAFLKFSTLNLVSNHRQAIPLAPWYAARIRATLWEDCGPCVQLACNMALEAGLHPDTVRAIVANDVSQLHEDIVLALDFTEQVLGHDSGADSLRTSIREHWGEDALISLALCISTARVYPALKYALGHGHACSLVQVAGRSVSPGTGRSATIALTAAAGLHR